MFRLGGEDPSSLFPSLPPTQSSFEGESILSFKVVLIGLDFEMQLMQLVGVEPVCLSVCLFWFDVSRGLMRRVGEGLDWIGFERDSLCSQD